MPPVISTVALGSGGLVVGAQGLGCMGMSEFYGDTDDASAAKTLAAAADAGVTMFDTADMYGQGANERFLSPPSISLSPATSSRSSNPSPPRSPATAIPT